jgi:hypothetical protein
MLKRVEFDLTDREFAALEAMARDAHTSVEVLLRRAVADLLAESLGTRGPRPTPEPGAETGRAGQEPPRA